MGQTCNSVIAWPFWWHFRDFRTVTVFQVTLLPIWQPAPFTQSPAVEMQKLSFMGRMLSLSAFAEDDVSTDDYISVHRKFTTMCHQEMQLVKNKWLNLWIWYEMLKVLLDSWTQSCCFHYVHLEFCFVLQTNVVDTFFPEPKVSATEMKLICDTLRLRIEDIRVTSFYIHRSSLWLIIWVNFNFLCFNLFKSLTV